MCDFVGLAIGVGMEDCFHGFDGGDGLAVGGEVCVMEGADLLESLGAFGLGAGKFNEGDFAGEAFDDFDAVAALRAGVPGFEEGGVVVGVDGVF